MFFGDWLGLAPILACTAGVIVLAVLKLVRLESQLLRPTGLISIGLALGTTARLWEVARQQPLSFTIGSWPAPAALSVSFQVDLIDVVLLIACFLSAFAIVGRFGSSEETAPIVSLASLGLAAVLFASADLTLVVVAWTVLCVLATVSLINRRRFADSIHPLAVALFGAPVLLAAAAELSSPPGTSRSGSVELSIGVAAVVLVGAAITGLGLFRRLRPIANDSPRLDVASDLIMPLVGFDLVLRTLTLMPGAEHGWLMALLVVLGISGVIEAADSARKAESFSDLVRAYSRSNLALALFALALGSAAAVSAALFLVAGTIIAQTLALANPTGWRARVGLGSLAGFPPLPGFLGRWACVMAALAAGNTMLALSFAVAIGVASFGLWRGLARLNLAKSVGELDQPSSEAGTLVPLGAVLTAALVPGPWLIATLQPATTQMGLLTPIPSLATSLIGIAFVIAPILVAAAPVRYPERSRRSLGRSRSPRRAARWTLEPAESLSNVARQIEERYGLAIGILIAVGTILALVT